MGIETSRRDDLESIGYILIYFLVGKLPWQGLRAGNTVQKHQLILDKKMSTSIEDLCVGCPRQFADYMRYCRALKFDAKPNIAYLRGLFRDLYKDKYNSDYTFEWDWERQPDKERRASKEMQGGSGGGEGGAAAAADGGREGASRRNGGAAEDGAGQKPLDTAGMARSGMMNSTPQMLTQVPVESRERSHRLNPEGGKLGSLGGAEKSGMPSLTGKGGGLQPMQPLAAKLGAPVEPPTQTAPPGDGAEELPAATTLRERRSSKDHRSKKVLQEAQQAAQAAQQGAAPTVLGSSVVKQADAGEVQRPKTSGGLVSRASSGGGGGYGKIMKWRSLGSNVHDTGATETKGGEGEATQAWGTGGGGGGGGGGRQRLGSGDSPTGGERPSTSGQSTSHLTAGTRSLMRYRRNRGASDGDASGNRPKTSGAGAPNAGR